MDRQEADERLRLRVLTMLAVAALAIALGGVGFAVYGAVRYLQTLASNSGGDDGKSLAAGILKYHNEVIKEQAECMAKHVGQPSLCADATLPVNAK